MLLRAGSAAVVVLLGWYLTVLLSRTRHPSFGTPIGFDLIAGFHVLGVAAVAGSALAQRRVKARYGWTLPIAGLLVELAFLGLNLSGVVWEYRKEGSASLLEAIVAFAGRLLK